MQAAGSSPSPEVVAPLCNTVGLIYAHRAEGHDGLQRLQEGPAVQALRGNVEQPQASSLHRGRQRCRWSKKQAWAAQALWYKCHLQE